MGRPRQVVYKPSVSPENDAHDELRRIGGGQRGILLVSIASNAISPLRRALEEQRQMSAWITEYVRMAVRFERKAGISSPPRVSLDPGLFLAEVKPRGDITRAVSEALSAHAAFLNGLGRVQAEAKQLLKLKPSAAMVRAAVKGCSSELSGIAIAATEEEHMKPVTPTELSLMGRIAGIHLPTATWKKYLQRARRKQRGGQAK